MADGTHGYHAIRLALQGRWDEINFGSLRETVNNYRGGTDSVPGSENYGTLAYMAALVIAWTRLELLSRVGITKGELITWWVRELRTRLDRGLQLMEADSRIYCIFSQAPICWLYRAFGAMRDRELRSLHTRYVLATAAEIALVGYPVQPVRLSPDVDDNAWPVPISVPLTGARSLEVGEHHHMLHSAFEMFAAHLMGIDWSRGGGSQTEWARDVIRRADPGWMGMSSREIEIFRNAIRSPVPELVDDLVEWLRGVGTRWRCRLVRFERGTACMRMDRSINGNTAPLFAMAIHEDGTLHWLGVHGRSHRVNSEPCDVRTIEGPNDRMRYVAVAGGEEWPQRNLILQPERWGRTLHDIEWHRDGRIEVHRPRGVTPVPPPNPPEPPNSSPRRKSDWVRYRYLAIALALAGVLIWWQWC